MHEFSFTAELVVIHYLLTFLVCFTQVGFFKSECPEPECTHHSSSECHHTRCAECVEQQGLRPGTRGRSVQVSERI